MSCIKAIFVFSIICCSTNKFVSTYVCPVRFVKQTWALAAPFQSPFLNTALYPLPLQVTQLPCWHALRIKMILWELLPTPLFRTRLQSLFSSNTILGSCDMGLIVRLNRYCVHLYIQYTVLSPNSCMDVIGTNFLEFSSLFFTVTPPRGFYPPPPPPPHPSKSGLKVVWNWFVM